MSRAGLWVYAFAMGVCAFLTTCEFLLGALALGVISIVSTAVAILSSHYFWRDEVWS